jgi:hypothetical protein
MRKHLWLLWISGHIMFFINIAVVGIMFEDQKVLEVKHIKKTMLPFKVRSVGLAGVDCTPSVEQVEVRLRHVNMPPLAVGWKCVNSAHYSFSVRTVGSHHVLLQMKEISSGNLFKPQCGL